MLFSQFHQELKSIQKTLLKSHSTYTAKQSYFSRMRATVNIRTKGPERSRASVKTARENGGRERGSRASNTRITLMVLRAFRKNQKTTVLQSTFNKEMWQCLIAAAKVTFVIGMIDC